MAKKKDVVLAARPREGVGKEAVKKLRAEGLLPGVIYGSDLEARVLTVQKQELIRALHAHGAHPLVTVELDGQDYLALEGGPGRPRPPGGPPRRLPACPGG